MHLRLSYPYGSRNTILAGQSLRVGLLIEGAPPGTAVTYPEEMALWRSSDPRVLTVQGVNVCGYQLMAHAPGTVTISTEWAGMRIEEEIHVVDPLRPERLWIYPDRQTPLAVNRASANYGNHCNLDVTENAGTIWMSSHPEVVAPEPGKPGTMRYVSDGAATIVACYGGHVATMDIHAEAGALIQIESLSADGRGWLVAGLVIRLDIGILCSVPDLVKPADVTLTCDPPGAVEFTLDRDGWHIAGKQAGKVTISASYGTSVCRKEIEVRAIPVVLHDIRIEDCFLAGDVQNIFIGQKRFVSVRLDCADAAYLPRDHNVRWSSSDPSVLEVSDSQVIGHREGKATLRAECLDQVAEVTVGVMEEPEINWY